MRPDLVGGQLFTSFPIGLRHSLLEIATVRRGCKPAALISLTAAQLVAGSAYLREVEIRAVVASSSQPSAYAQIALPERLRLRSKPRIRVYIAASEDDARTLAECDQRGDYARVGELLGYPECCVTAAVARDTISYDNLFATERQSNLVDAALQASAHVDFACNVLLRESPVCQFGPASLISHYPCSFDCPRTINLAEAYYDILAEEWPLWALQLVELLRSPIVLWSDRWWPPQFWDELAGVAQLGGVADPEQRRVSGGWSMPIGLGRTPGGLLPMGAVEIEIRKDATAFCVCDAEQTVSHAAAGRPAVLDWRTGRIEGEAGHGRKPRSPQPDPAT